ncbi:MAG TPA: hypothetical protein VMU03_13620 [Gammaproteobacteria bacterium]|nr:hypothetical protein [Gammaproteobacteria bacterium]
MRGVIVADNTPTPPTQTTAAAKDKHVSSSIFRQLIGATACAATVTPIARKLTRRDAQDDPWAAALERSPRSAQCGVGKRFARSRQWHRVNT